MTIKGICQPDRSRRRWHQALLAWLPVLWVFSPGCVLLISPPPAPPAAIAPPAPWVQASGGGGVWLAAALLGLGMAWCLGRRLARARREGAGPLDREDLALLRTARDALRFLLRKRSRRLWALVHPRDRGRPVPPA